MSKIEKVRGAAGGFYEIGQRLKAYRLGAGLSPEEVAERLGVSRAAMYRIEAGHVVKIETLERLAHVLGTSVASLLGVGVEYYARATGYFERMRQLEMESEKVIAHFEPFSYLLTSPSYTDHLRQMLIEAIPKQGINRSMALKEVENCLAVLAGRKENASVRRPSIVSIVSLSELQRFVSLGMVGRLDLPVKVKAERVELARQELKHLAELMDDEPMGVQIGLVEETLPGVTFQIFQSPSGARLAVSPFRLGELPNIRNGIATVTESPEAVQFYTQFADDLWRRAIKGTRGAALLRQMLKRSKRN